MWVLQHIPSLLHKQLIILQALEIGDRQLTADLFSHLTEAHVGIAGYECEQSPAEKAENLRLAVQNAERLYEGEFFLLN